MFNRISKKYLKNFVILFSFVKKNFFKTYLFIIIIFFFSFKNTISVWQILTFINGEPEVWYITLLVFYQRHLMDFIFGDHLTFVVPLYSIKNLIAARKTCVLWLKFLLWFIKKYLYIIYMSKIHKWTKKKNWRYDHVVTIG